MAEQPRRRVMVGLTRLQLAMLVVCTMLLAIIGSTWGSQLLVDRVSSTDLNNEVANALVANCEKNLVYRKQARERTKANDQGTRLQIRANDALAQVVREIQQNGTTLQTIGLLGQRLKRVNDQLREIRENTTALLPLPDCSDYHDLLSGSG